MCRQFKTRCYLEKEKLISGIIATRWLKITSLVGQQTLICFYNSIRRLTGQIESTRHFGMHPSRQPTFLDGDNPFFDKILFREDSIVEIKGISHDIAL